MSVVQCFTFSTFYFFFICLPPEGPSGTLAADIHNIKVQTSEAGEQ